MTSFLVGTRGSQLSLAQTNSTLGQLKSVNPNVEFEIKTIKTSGDISAKPLFAMNQRGIFEKEIDNQVLSGTVDFAIHSMKDVPSQIDSELFIACVPIREAANDVLISTNGVTLDDIPSNSIIGTSSLRRAVQILRKRPDVQVKPIRGNIETRIGKVSGDYSAVVLAQAGIARLNLDVTYTPLDIATFVPSSGQGALALICRKDNDEISDILQTIEDHNTRCAIDAERSFSESVDSGCRFPVGVYAQVNGSTLNIHTAVFSADGKDLIQDNMSGDPSMSYEIGKKLGDRVVEMGADKFAIGWREEVEKWNRQ